MTWIVLAKQSDSAKWGIFLQTEHEEFVTEAEEICEERGWDSLSVDVGN